MTERDIVSRLRYLLFVSSTETMRVQIALGSLLWGLLLACPGDTFSRPTYTDMSAIASEELWALAHIVHGTVAIWSVLTGIRCRGIFLLDPVLGCVLWTASGIAMMLSVSPPPAAIAPHLVGAVTSWWLLVRYMWEVK